MTSKLLPLADPPINGYLHHAYTFSIMANHSEYLPWLYSNFIQLRCYRDIVNKRPTDYFNFYNYDYASDAFPWLIIQKVPISILNQDIVGFVVDAIEEDYYIATFLDKFYLSDRTEYQKKHFIHDNFVFGYNQEEGTFETASFNNEGIYEQSKISFSEFHAAFPRQGSDLDYQNYLYRLKFNKNGHYPFDVKLVKDLLIDYLQSRNTSDRYRMFKPPMDAAFGMEVYQSLKHYYELLLDNQISYDIRPVHILWEHKKCMLDRIEYMGMNGYLPSANAIYNNYERIEKKVQNMRLLMLRSFMDKDKSMLHRIMRMIDEISASEAQILGEMVDQLERSTKDPQLVI